MMDQANAKRLVAESGKMLLDEKLAARTWGNISCRVGKGSMVITPSGLGYEGMKPDDIVSMDMATGEWEGTRKPSSEKGIHIFAYRQFPDVGFVIHTHQSYASAIGLTGFNSSLSEEDKKALGGVALAKYGLSSTKKLARNVSSAFESGAHVVLMAHHGAVIAGKDQSEAFNRALLLEDVCRRACMGQPKAALALDETLANRLMAAAKEKFGHAAYTASAPVLACASDSKAISAQLDDMAQMIGPRLPVVKPDESTVIKALRKGDVVLVPGAGAICRASTDGDLSALCLLAEKACICWLHTQAKGVSGRLSAFEIRLMRIVYLMKYSKKIGG
jgi:ribulose-5-phosphate 4-epimerase/fuculose-1-phosphate aldolase